MWIKDYKDGGRWMSDILEITDLLKIKCLLLTVDIEKAFGSIYHQFLIKVLKRLDLRKT